MNEMQAHGLLIPVGSKPSSGDDRQAERDLCGPVHRLQRPSTGYKEYIHIKYGIEPDQYQFQNEHAAGDKHEKSTKSLAEVATEARESSLVLSQDEGNHDDSGNDIGNSRPIDHEYPISH